MEIDEKCIYSSGGVGNEQFFHRVVISQFPIFKFFTVATRAAFTHTFCETGGINRETF